MSDPGTMTDMARRAALAAAVGAGMLMGGAGFAEAETLSFSVSRSGPEPVTASDTMSFQQFNPALGTLTGVTVTYQPDEADTYVLAVVNVLGGEGSFAVASTSAQMMLYVAESGLPLMSGETSTATASCSFSNFLIEDCNGFDDTFVNSGIGPNPVQLSLPADLVPFQGTGTVDLIAELMPDFSSSESLVQGQPGYSHSANWFGRVDVTYQYEPTVATPEPASLALLGAALGLAGLLSRRRRG